MVVEGNAAPKADISGPLHYSMQMLGSLPIGSAI